MVRHVKTVKPEFANLGQHPALVWNQRGQNIVESTNSVARDHQVKFADIVNVANFALPNRNSHHKSLLINKNEDISAKLYDMTPSLGSPCFQENYTLPFSYPCFNS